MFAMVLHFFTFFTFFLQGIAFCSKAPPATGFYSCGGGGVKYGIQLSQISIPIQVAVSVIGKHTCPPAFETVLTMRVLPLASTL